VITCTPVRRSRVRKRHVIRAIVDAAESLDVTGSYDGEVFSLRYILAHMIEEYARHNGHADLLRERLDGATGE
jgi:hypothetical protein